MASSSVSVLNLDVGNLINSMTSTTLSFVGDVVFSFWGLFLSLALLALFARWILRKGRGASN